MKKLVIIEDSFEDLKRIVNLFDKEFICIPDSFDNVFRSLRSNISASYNPNTIKSKRDDATNQINEFLNNNLDVGCFIIDLQLKEGNKLATGKAFYDNFIANNEVLSRVPVLFFTGITSPMIINDLKLFVNARNEILPIKLLEYLQKQENWYEDYKFNKTMLGIINNLIEKAKTIITIPDPKSEIL